jgi:hypothetical protein
MNLENCCNLLAENAQRIRALVETVTEDQARWKPDPQSWSILEVVNHLLDEENLDFRVRLEITLFRPDEPWPAIDPQGWITERHYNQRELGKSLTDFLSARGDSLAGLCTLSVPNWTASYEASWGMMRAGDLMASWVGHDLLHMRQLVELHWAYTAQVIQPYSPDYAGGW